jgi:LysM repeat protein
MEFRDANTGQIKTWVWGVIALGFVVLMFVITKVIGGGQTTAAGTIPADGQSSDITDILAQLQESLNDLEGTTPTTPTPTPTPTPSGQAYKQYTVLKNDTWRDIAGKFGMTLDQFFEKNPTLKRRDLDVPRVGGRNIFVFDVAPKTATPKSYVVRAGDTWNELIAANNISLARFFQLNPSLDTKREKAANRERTGGRTVIVGTSYT